MDMAVDEGRRDEHPGGVNQPAPLVPLTDRRDPAIHNRDVPPERFAAVDVDHRPALDDEVGRFLSLGDGKPTAPES